MLSRRETDEYPQGSGRGCKKSVRADSRRKGTAGFKLFLRPKNKFSVVEIWDGSGMGCGRGGFGI